MIPAHYDAVCVCACSPDGSTQGQAMVSFYVIMMLCMCACYDAVCVCACSPDGSAQGQAMVSFYVNKSPSDGVCEIRPDSGLEMDTEFRVFCKEWRDEVRVATTTPQWH
jgi:hypothetical protein